MIVENIEELSILEQIIRKNSVRKTFTEPLGRQGFDSGFRAAYKEINSIRHYAIKDMEKAFIAGGKMARNFENPGFDEFIEQLNKEKNEKNN